ncbi:MAG: hypothetical protein ACYCYO_01990 [Bacilli bacterium]
MALLNEVDLKLNITATDKAGEILKTLVAEIDVLKSALTDLADIQPFANLEKQAASLSGVLTDIKSAFTSLTDITVTDIFAPLQASSGELLGNLQGIQRMLTSVDETMISDVLAPLQNSAYELKTDLQTVKLALTSLEEMPVGDLLAPLQATASEIVDSLGTVRTYMVDIVSSAATDPFTPWLASAQELLTTVDETKASMLSMGGAGGTTGAAGGKSGVASESSASGGMLAGLGEMVSGMGSKLLMGGMNAMMTYYGMQAFANSAGNLSNIQQMMQLGQGKTRGTYGTTDVNEAAQAYAMLGMAGMTGSQGSTFLTGLKSSLRSMFTRVGGSGISKNALLLEQYGLNPALGMSGASPWAALQGIQQSYMKAMNSGQGSAAASILSYTGTSQLATLFQHWGAAQQMTSGINLGMTGTQLNQNVSKDLTLEANLQKLSLAFTQLAVSLIPVINPLVTAFTNLLHVTQTLTGDPSAPGSSKVTKGKNSTAFSLNYWMDQLLHVSPLTPSAWNNATKTGAKPDLNSSISFEITKAIQSLFSGSMGKSAAGSIFTQSGMSAALAVTSQEIQKWANSTWHYMAGGLSQTWQQLSAWATGTWHWMAAGLGATWKHLSSWATGVWTWMRQGLASFPGQLSSWIKGMFTWLHQGLSSFPSELASWAKELFSWMDKGLNTFPAQLTNWAGGLWNSFLHGAANFATGLAQWGASLWQDVARYFGLPTGTKGSSASSSAAAVAKAAVSTTSPFTSHAGLTTPSSFVSSLPSSGSNVVINHTVNNNITGTSDPVATGNAAAEATMKATAALFNQRMKNMMQIP